MSKRKPKPTNEVRKHEPLATRAIETFRRFGAYEISNMSQSEPSCFNGDVRVRRYRITVEEITEPDDVIAARIQKLWDESDNHHHYDPLRRAAAEIGYELQGDRGGKRAK